MQAPRELIIEDLAPASRSRRRDPGAVIWPMVVVGEKEVSHLRRLGNGREGD